jgi:arylsulfatase A-like enzyme
MKNKTNLLIVHAHDMGRYNAAYGFSAPTPHMAKLAEDGLVFRDAHCAAPTCSPSRAAMLTGRTAHEMNMLGLLHRGFNLNDYSRHLARRLSAQGYAAAMSGVQHEFRSDEGDEHVYDQILEQEVSKENRDLVAANAAAKFVKEQDASSPWFLWLGLFYPHRDFLPPDTEKHKAYQLKVPDILPDTPEIREDMAGYLASVDVTDQALGRVLDALEASGQAENTLVILTTDHGIAFPEMKCSLTAHGTGITWVMRHPHLIPKGQVSDALVSHLDLVPTVMDLLDLELPEDVHGQSLKPVIEQPQSATVREDLFAEVNVHAAIEPKRSVRTKTANYIRKFQSNHGLILPNTDDSPSKSLWLEAGWEQKCRGEIELYDLVLDPQERRNVADDPAYAEIRSDMERRLLRWMEETDDPLLKGPLVVPAGAIINDTGSRSPCEETIELKEARTIT